MTEIHIAGSLEEGYLDATCGSLKVGYLWCVVQDDRSILLSEIQVFDEAIIARTWPASWIPWSLPKTASYRNRGIGRALMTTFLRLTDEAAVSRIYGSLTAGDLAISPFLESWYISLGFVLLPPDHECVLTARNKIQRLKVTKPRINHN